MEPQIVTGRVSWFKLDKKFGFLALDDGPGDAFLHVSVLKAAGYVSVPAGTTMRVRIEKEQGVRCRRLHCAMPPTNAPQPPSGVARKDGNRVRLYSRPGNDAG